MSKTTVSTLLSLTKQTLSICPVSGIPYSISFPNLGIDFTHKSPYATLSNIKTIADLPFPKLKALPKVTLAGILLAYMRFTNLCETYNIRSIDCNIALQLCTTHSLISTIKRINDIPTRKLAILPKLSFSSMMQVEGYSTTQDMLKHWLEACNEVLHPTTVEDVEIEELTITTSTVVAKKPKNISVDDKKALKANIAEVCKDPLCSVKLATVLNYLTDGMSMITMDSTMRSKIIEKLKTFDSDAATAIIQMLNKYGEILEDDFMDRAMDNSAIVKAKPSLSEILAARRLVPAIGTMS